MTGQVGRSGASLVIEDLSKSYRSGPVEVAALRSVSLTVGSGEVVALVGNNGAGKSTLMSIVAGLLAADGGSVVVTGRDALERRRDPKQVVGLAPQEEALYPTLTVRRNLEYFGRLASLRGSALRERVDEVARRLLIDDLLDRMVRTLSGGQRRRLHTGLALMHDPDVLLLDEPTVGVDVGSRSELLDLVRRTATTGAAVLYSTHNLAEVEQLAARVVILDRGRVLAEGSAADLIANHAPLVAELRFSDGHFGLPRWMMDSVDRISDRGGEHHVVVRLERPAMTIHELVSALSESDRDRLCGAVVVQPSLEQAYLRLVRRAGDDMVESAEATDGPWATSRGESP